MRLLLSGFVLMIGIVIGVSGNIEVVSVPPIAPYMPSNILIKRTGGAGIMDNLEEVTVTTYDAQKTTALTKYSLIGQGKQSLNQALGDLYQARYAGYFTEVPTEKITLKIACRYDTGTFTVFTDEFTVKKEMTIAYFRPEADDKEVNDKVESFVRQGVNRLNEGKFGPLPFEPILREWKINLKSYQYSTNQAAGALLAYGSMKKDLDSLAPLASILGLGSNDQTEVAAKEMIRDGYAVTSFRKDVSETLTGDKFKYLNRLELTENVFLDNVFGYLKDHGWTSLVILQTSQDEFRSVAWTKYAAKYGIDTINLLIGGTEGQEVDLDNEFGLIKESGRRIILTTATGDLAKNIFKYALKHEVTSSKGFQWVGLKNVISLQFLDKNSEDWCIDNTEGLKLCIMEFKGTIVLNNMYYHMFNTTEGELMWRSYLNYDTMRNPISRSYLDTADFASIGVEMALGYDALKVNLYAMERLLRAKKPITGEGISAGIRSGEVTGLSGPIKLDSDGVRSEFHGTVATLWPMEEYLGVYNKASKDDWANRLQSDWHTARVFERDANREKLIYKRVWSRELVQRFMASEKFHSEDFQGLHKCRIPDNYWDVDYMKSIYSFNKIGITYCKGKMRAEDNLLEQRASQYRPKQYIGYDLKDKPFYRQNFPYLYYDCPEEVVVERIIPPFYCEQGCGDVVDESNTNVYTNGECVSHGKCQCSGTPNGTWSGSNCRDAYCKGVKNECPNGGKCVAPETCECAKGWTGKDCTTPVCGNCDAIGGGCDVPGLCECKPGFFGAGDATTKACSKIGSCVQANAGNSGKVNPATGHCITCKTGYFSPSSDCKHSMYMIFGVFAGVIVLLIVGGFLSSRFYTTWKKTKELMKNNDWLLDWDDVKIADQSMSQKSSMMISAISMNANANTANKKFNVGTFDGMEVYYQKIEKETVVIDNETRAEINAVRDLKHPNLCIVIGCCVVAPNVAIITELQPKGSLEDLFGNEDIKLPWNFRFGLIKGIIEGLTFISQSPMKCHGRLKTSNILVDNRWTVKLTGLGLKRFKSGSEGSKQDNFGSLLWTAPELIRSQNLNNLDALHTDSNGILNDIYALGIILSEFCTRDLPYSEVMLEKQEMIHLITGQNVTNDAKKIWDEFLTEHNIENGGVVRPLIREHQWPKKYEIRKQIKLLMEACWKEDPTARPSLADIKAMVEAMDPRKGELIEHLVSMLEQYGNNLEHIVTKRTVQLTKESQRTEDLVSRLLPKSVSEALKAGGTVEPETFEYTTIYFSDIVGFTSIAKASNPFQVVALLNAMYTLFDGISARHDVYKVETIGDAYMIVSGLPTRNGDLHAGEICTTALELMVAIGSFKVPHMPETKLQLRSGVHTGNVVAGVVGLKMPRYCLFGDSVNVASEMESGGHPSRVQVSSATQGILERLGGYHLEYRDEIDTAKGGNLGRYFLNGKDGFTGEMPAHDYGME